MTHTLLLADDSATIQRVIELTFADEHVRVIAVADGQQAMERIRADRPDIVLADTHIPTRDGYEVAAFVKQTPELAHIPVLLLTGAFETVDEARAQSARCDGVLTKPFEPRTVIQQVRQLLGIPDEQAAPRGWQTRSAAHPSRAQRPRTGPSATSARDQTGGARGVPGWDTRQVTSRAPAPPSAAGRPEPPAAAAQAPAWEEETMADSGARAWDWEQPTAVGPTADVGAAVVEPDSSTWPEPAPVRAEPEPAGEWPELPADDEDTRFVADRRPPEASAGGRQAPSLEEYFDRLDAAFAALDGKPVAASPARPLIVEPPSWDSGEEPFRPERPAVATESKVATPERWKGPEGRAVEPAAAKVAPASQPAPGELSAEESEELIGRIAERVLNLVPAPKPVDINELAERAAALAAARVPAVPQISPEDLVERVSRAVLGRVQAQPPVVGEELITRLVQRVSERMVAVPTPQPMVTDELVEHIARRVLAWLPQSGAPAGVDEAQLAERVVHLVFERMTDRVLREVVGEIVVKAADRLVREEIERLKGSSLK